QGNCATVGRLDPARGSRINVEPTPLLRELLSGRGFVRRPAGTHLVCPGSQRARATAGLEQRSPARLRRAMTTSPLGRLPARVRERAPAKPALAALNHLA